ncbi:MAG: MlaD family protein [Lentimicrobiaceae bacterium]|nr:MlaD family protein [Lentimicrobiaceae bacterium]
MEEKSKPPKHSERNAKSIKVAVFCILAILILYFGANFLKGIDTFSKKEFYYSVYENSGGLHTGAVIYLQGFPIGKVTKVKLISNNPVRIMAEYLINDKIQIPVDSRFEVTSKDMLGGIIVRLELGTATEFVRPGDTITSIVAPQMLEGIEPMKDQIANILSSVDTIAVVLKDLLYSQNGGEKLAQTLSHIESVTASLDQIVTDNKEKFGKIVNEITKFSETLTEISPELRRIVTNFDQIADSIAKANVAEVIVNANSTVLQLEEVVRKMHEGDGNVAKLLNEDDLYTKLGNTLQSLDDLLVDIKQNPKKYINVTIFGGKKDKQ